MPTLFKKLLFTGVITLFCASAFAQKGIEDGSKYGHGEDSLRCLKNLSLFSEYVKQKAYADALPSWEIVYNECPLASKRVYTDGVKIKEWQIKKEKDKAKKDVLIDELMAIYDQRIKYFGNDRKYGEDYILGLKATSLYNFKNSDKESRVLVQEWLKKSIDGKKAKSGVSVLVTYMQNTDKMFEFGQATPEDMVNSYLLVTDLLSQQIELTSKETSKEKLRSIRDNIEKLFATSGAADCKTIETIFAPQLADNTTNLDWLKMVNKLLAKADCEDAQLLYDVSENLHVIEPSSSSAYGLARMYLKTQDLDKAIEFYNEAISLEEEPIQKGTYYYQLGLIMYNKGKLSDSRSNARKAIELRSDWGEPYLLIGNLYAQSAKNFGTKEFEHKTAYWAAVDQFAKAKRVDASVAPKANELIKLYSQYFPGTEEIFFEGLTAGASYSLGGWINTTTKVRAK